MSNFVSALIACCLLFLGTAVATAQPIELIVDSSQSSISISVLGNSDTSSVTGTGAIELVPTNEPFSTAQLTELDLVLADGFSISFLVFVSISAEPGEVTLNLLSPGAAGSVNGSNQFDQLQNEAMLTGDVDLNDPLGLVGGSATFNLADAGANQFDILGAQLNVNGDELTVSASFEVAVEVSDGVNVSANGSVVLTGMLPDEILVGDVNCDGAIDLADIPAFVSVLSNGEYFAKADINQDDLVSLADIPPFVELLSGK